MKRQIISLVGCLSILIVTGFIFNSTFASSGGGGDGSGVPAGCSDSYFQHICNDGHGLHGSHGGASWRIYAVGSGPVYAGHVVTMSEGEYNSTMSAINSACADTGYYAAAGWDNRNGTHGAFLTGSFRLALRQGGYSPIDYNSAGAVTGAEILNNGAGAYVGERITSAGAMLLYSAWAGEGGVGYSNAGWFCLDVEPEEEEEPPVIEETTCETWPFVPGSWRASNSEGGVSSVVSKVRNITLGDNWKDETYAKPTDKIRWRHCYYPGAQKVAFTETTGIGVTSPGSDGLHGTHDQNLGAGGTTPNFYKPLHSFFGRWSNFYKVTSDKLRNPNPNQKSYAVGVTNVEEILDDYNIPFGRGSESNGKGGSVALNKAGKTLIEESETGFPTSARVSNNGRHNWECDYGQSCSKCGGGQCTQYDYSAQPDPVTGLYPCLSHAPCDYCYRDTCHHSNDYKAGYASGDSAKDNAKVLVPYNFINGAEVALENPNYYVYAGETTMIKYATAYTYPRPNAVTKGTYATQVDNAAVKLIAYISSGTGGGGIKGSPCDGLEQCKELAGASGLQFNPDGYLIGGAVSYNILNHSGGSIFNVHDAPAGKYFCVASAVYPASSGHDTQMSPSGDGMWFVSPPDCRVIAKKPSMQVWGNGLYTAGKIDVKTSQKYIVAGGFHDYVAVSSDNILFGSWVEQNVIANGLVNLASGASTGGAGSTSRTKGGFGGSYNGSRKVDICILNPLTMPNSGCSSVGTFAVGGSSGSMQKPNDKAALIAKFTSDGGNFNSIKNVTNIATTYIPKGETRVYSGEGDITISGNITYADGYINLTDIPKVIIYAKGSIVIGCGVTRIDAVLISDKYTVTCNSSGDANSRDRSLDQLVINGSVITNRLYATRTYGAATGLKSGEPAEVINYDTSLYLWGASRADVNNSGKLDTVYQTELAPRL